MISESEHIKLNKEKWDKWAESADGKGFRYDFLRRAQGKLISSLDIKENVSFLDIGCGTGWAVGQAANSVNYKGSFYGVDLSVKMIEKARENFKDLRNFHFINANSESIPLDDNLFDIIICTNSFHHYLNPEKALKEMGRLLKSGGKLYILDPTADILIIKILSFLMKMSRSGHVRLYSTPEFKGMITGAGLSYSGPLKIYHEKAHIGEKQADPANQGSFTRDTM
jgi:ubiquinone/menaquinone biosynthesis C-methylase UbiE